MDAHFNEYLAAIAGMNELYGDRPDDQPTEFHDAHDGVTTREPAGTIAAA
jgi:hypothetical protein